MKFLILILNLLLNLILILSISIRGKNEKSGGTKMSTSRFNTLDSISEELEELEEPTLLARSRSKARSNSFYNPVVIPNMAKDNQELFINKEKNLNEIFSIIGHHHTLADFRYNFDSAGYDDLSEKQKDEVISNMVKATLPLFLNNYRYCSHEYHLYEKVFIYLTSLRIKTISKYGEVRIPIIKNDVQDYEFKSDDNVHVQGHEFIRDDNLKDYEFKRNYDIDAQDYDSKSDNNVQDMYNESISNNNHLVRTLKIDILSDRTKFLPEINYILKDLCSNYSARGFEYMIQIIAVDMQSQIDHD